MGAPTRHHGCVMQTRFLGLEWAKLGLGSLEIPWGKRRRAFGNTLVMREECRRDWQWTGAAEELPRRRSDSAKAESVRDA